MSAKYISRISLCSILLLLLAPSAFAAVGTFGSYVGIDTGGGNVFYGASQPGSNYLTAFDGADLGDFTVGDTLTLSGAELLTWKNGGGDVFSASIQFAVYLAGSSPGIFGEVGVGYTADATFNDAAGNTFSNTGDQKWANIASAADLMAGLTAGSYEVAVYFKGNTNEGLIYDSNGGNNFVAAFDVNAAPSGIPEPASLLMALAGLLSLVAFSRRRR